MKDTYTKSEIMELLDKIEGGPAEGIPSEIYENDIIEMAKMGASLFVETLFDGETDEASIQRKMISEAALLGIKQIMASNEDMRKQLGSMGL